MQIYLRKVFPHDVTHEVSVTTAIVNEFFDGATIMNFVAKTSGKKGKVTINSATDPRFGGDFKSLLVSEGDIDIDDLILITKRNSDYLVELIKKDKKNYSSFYELFQKTERHIIFSLDDEGSDTEDTNEKEIKVTLLDYEKASLAERKQIFIAWFKKQIKPEGMQYGGKPYSDDVIKNYADGLEYDASKLDNLVIENKNLFFYVFVLFLLRFFSIWRFAHIYIELALRGFLIDYVELTFHNS